MVGFSLRSGYGAESVALGLGRSPTATAAYTLNTKFLKIPKKVPGYVNASLLQTPGLTLYLYAHDRGVAGIEGMNGLTRKKGLTALRTSRHQSQETAF